MMHVMIFCRFHLILSLLSGAHRYICEEILCVLSTDGPQDLQMREEELLGEVADQFAASTTQETFSTVLLGLKNTDKCNWVCLRAFIAGIYRRTHLRQHALSTVITSDKESSLLPASLL